MLVEGSYQVLLERILEALKKARRARIRTGLLRPNEHLCQYILSAATMPSYGMRSVKNYMKKNFPNVSISKLTLIVIRVAKVDHNLYITDFDTVGNRYKQRLRPPTTPENRTTVCARKYDLFYYLYVRLLFYS